MHLPKGYKSLHANLGIKDDTLDFGLVLSSVDANWAGLFTNNQVKGNPVLYGQKLLKKKGPLRAVMVNSKNSNVATGKQGYEDCKMLCKAVENELNIPHRSLFPSSTGVIGRRLPVKKMLDGLKNSSQRLIEPADFDSFAKAIMTTDTHHKITSAKIGDASLVGIAKGSGMIEPNMATMLCFFFTDAKFSAKDLQRMLKKAAGPTFNSLSIDSDMSTSDTALLMANGLAGKVDQDSFYNALLDCSTELTKMLARDGEGATKLLIVDVENARSVKDAKLVGKAVINSPLVKTAIYQGDPNWGRVFMAAGKSGASFDADKISIAWGEKRELDSMANLEKLQKYLQHNETLHLTINLNQGKKSWRVYGCDLTEEYVKINAYYTT